jgi:hypothetical protein
MNDLKQETVNSQIDPTSGLAINCQNCIHCDRSEFGSRHHKCLKSGGAYCGFVQQFPQLYGHICRNYSAWSPRQKSIFELIGDKIRKMLET